MKIRIAGCTAVFCLCIFAAATINVPAGGDFQAALNSATAGDVILLAPGAAYQGPFSRPVNPGNDYITIRSGAADSSLPRPASELHPPTAAFCPGWWPTGRLTIR